MFKPVSSTASGFVSNPVVVQRAGGTPALPGQAPVRLGIDGTRPAKQTFDFMLHHEFIPAAESRAAAPPRLMVMLHGLGDSIEGYRWMPEAMGLPWLNYLLVNAPDDYYGGYSWFELDDMAPGIQRSRKLLFDLLEDLRAKHFPAEQITFGGFSQGCLMAD